MDGDFRLETLEPLVNPVRQYHNRAKRQPKQSAIENITCNSIGTVCEEEQTKLADVLAKIACLPKINDSYIDRTKLVRTYSVKLRIKKTSLYKCFDCDSTFTNADFLELHEKSHAAATPLDSSSGRQDIDLSQEQQAGEDSETNPSQNVWFAGDIYEADEENGDQLIHLDCTVEEREDNLDITFDRAKCEKTYTVKYKVKKEPIGKCEVCEKSFYSVDSLDLHKMEHERFISFDDVEPIINIDSPKIEESTLIIDESFYQALSEVDSSDTMELSESTPDVKISPGKNEMTLRCRIVPQKSTETILPSLLSTENPTICSKSHSNEATILGKYECEICSKRFRFRPAYNVHMRTHDNSRPYQCKNCHRKFISRLKLFLHSYGHTRDRVVSDGCRQWTCSSCSEKFDRPWQLLEHSKRSKCTSRSCSTMSAVF